MGSKMAPRIKDLIIGRPSWVVKQLKMTKKTHFQRLLTAQKCCKKQYRIKIFVLSDQKDPKKGCPNFGPKFGPTFSFDLDPKMVKQLKMIKKNTFSKIAHGAKVLVPKITHFL